MKLIDITGLRFGRLAVLSKSERPRMWECQCDCGNITMATGTNLRSGSTRSCGCLAAEWAQQLGANKEFIAKRSGKVTTHGHKRRNSISPEYRTWLGMKRRCGDTNYKDYPNWGGRGIRVCGRWDESFEAFLSDMGARPSTQHSIDRIDPNLDYAPDNCRWATATEQGAENKRSNIAVTVGAMTFQSVYAAARHFGVNPDVALRRISDGIDPATAVSHVGRLPARRSKESYLPKEARLARE